MKFNNSHRDRLVAIYHAALRAVNGKHCVEQYLLENPIDGDVYLLAIGKAAVAMSEGATECLGSKIKGNLVITHQKHLPDNKSLKLNFFQSAHPIPDKRSIEAGKRLINFIDSVPAGATLICLVSGGTSALVEVLPEGLTIKDLQVLNNWLLKSGLAIGEINAIRKRVSLIKGGRLATRLKELQTTVLLISDVKGDNPADIGSGLFFPPTESDLGIRVKDYPQHISRLFGMSPDMPQKEDPVFNRVEAHLVASLDKAKKAACQFAVEEGYEVILHESYLQGDAIDAGTGIARDLMKQPGKLHIWGGECTVKLPERPGTGGRCQSLALSAAIAMDSQPDWCLLAAGTDGNDGAEGIAGACVDNHTMIKSGDSLEQLKQYLMMADAGSCLKKTNDLIITGDTGTNVTDLVLGYCEYLL